MMPSTLHALPQTLDELVLCQPPRGWAQLTAAVKGLVAETQVAAWLASLGFDLWRPLQAQHRSDLAILQRGQLVRLQIKTARFVPARQHWRVSLGRRGRDGHVLPYTAREISFLVVFVPSQVMPQFYLVPVKLASARATATLRPGCPRPRRPGGGPDWEAFRGAAHLLHHRGKPSRTSHRPAPLRTNTRNHDA